MENISSHLHHLHWCVFASPWTTHAQHISVPMYMSCWPHSHKTRLKTAWRSLTCCALRTWQLNCKWPVFFAHGLVKVLRLTRFHFFEKQVHLDHKEDLQCENVYPLNVPMTCMLQCHVVQSLVAIHLYRWLCASQCNSKCFALVANIGAFWGLSAQLFFVASNVPRSMICIPNESLRLRLPYINVKYVFNAITRFKVPKLIGWNWDQGGPFQTTPPDMF